MSEDKPTPLTEEEIAQMRGKADRMLFAWKATGGVPEADCTRDLLRALDALDAERAATAESDRLYGQESERREAAVAMHDRVAGELLREREARAEAEAKVAKLTERRFPIQDGPSIPWRVIAPHERQAERNHDQSLETLARRGGLSPCEAVAVLEDRRWRRMDQNEAKASLVELTDPTGTEDATAKRIAADIREWARPVLGERTRAKLNEAAERIERGDWRRR